MVSKVEHAPLNQPLVNSLVVSASETAAAAGSRYVARWAAAIGKPA